MTIDWLKVSEITIGHYLPKQAIEEFLRLNEHLLLNEEEFYTFLPIAGEMIHAAFTWISWGSIDSWSNMLCDCFEIWLNNIRPLTKFKDNNNEQ